LLRFSRAGHAPVRARLEDGSVTPSPNPQRAVPRLQSAIVLSAAEDECTVYADDETRVVSYAEPFPRPRAGRVAPGNLVATASESGGSEVIVWRWFDAVVVSRAGPIVTLWEPNHGTVLAQPRDPQYVYRPGSRAYVSAGLPGADWWVAGAVDRTENAVVDLDEVRDFFTSHGLWDRLP
jgi:hypothetical protein